MNDPKPDSSSAFEDRITHVLSEWLNDSAPIGEEAYRRPALRIRELTLTQDPVVVAMAEALEQYKNEARIVKEPMPTVAQMRRFADEDSSTAPAMKRYYPAREALTAYREACGRKGDG